ncbi:S24 family peptidase [Arcobacter sp. LA11]|uniref:S24 family peptidase n=1 Tax=Arcobacter sp. LA11 TaxID=1898176 RepID=UPI0009322682|nr:S24 family peptidase [Arcobacter sp. LA11]
MEKLDLITLEYKDIFDNNKDKKIEFSKDLLPKKYNLNSLFVVRVDGESMQPVINDRALVVADLSQKEIINDSIYLVYKENKMWIKKALILDGKTRFVSINSDYSHLIYDLKDIHVVAKVLLTFRTF